ncbi:PKD domain-containing protein [Nocardioides sp.]|uniref:PKD domain-containing protein n=1 Tax=Nocardioides sp. TaxID=35761 RepID=UPI002716B4E4|nr:PKD domain-containing protein [Nocardioides sp.]MDO9454520.1 PKD domain-containing protein [Nocardioides sp.]
MTRLPSTPSRVLGAAVTLLVLVGLLAVTRLSPDAVAAEPTRTWVVDAVDDGRGNRWESVETGTSTVRVAIGDTVEWQFDRAVIDHDLTSATDSPTAWLPPVEEFRTPGGAPFRYTFDRPGTYSYLCSIHGTVMTGTVVVEEPGQVNQAPTADPMVGTLTGTAPLAVSVMAHADDADDDPLTYLWDFGTGAEADRSTFEDASFVYTTPGFYHLRLQVSDGRGGVLERTWQVTVGGGGDAPLVDAVAAPTSGPAPLPVAFTGRAHDTQGGTLTWAWDFGVAGTQDVASTPAATFTYDAPGTYTATLRVTDAEGHLGVDTVEVIVTGDGAAGLPEVVATAAPRTGRAPLGVRFSTEVTTGGDVRAYSDGLTSYPDLAGTATLVRRRGASYASIDVSGLKPGAAHQVHVHERSCADERGGVHYRFDETQPFGEANEIWLYFTSDAQGRSTLVESTRPLRAGPQAAAIVVHDPDNPARRIGCVDLVPSTVDLAYDWDFGDGTTGEGPDPDHVYAADGTYTATVTVASVHAGHGTGLDATTSSSVEVVVDSVAPQTTVTGGPSGPVRSRSARFRLTGSESGSTFACRLDGGTWAACPTAATFRALRDGRHTLQVRATDGAGNTDPTPAARTWTVDTTGPVVRATRPTGTTRDRTPTLRVTVTDRDSSVRRQALVLRLDDNRVGPGRYVARTGVLTWTPTRPLARGPHRVRLQAVDALGHRTVRTWRFRVG